MGGRVTRKYLLIGVFCITLLGFMYQFQAPACMVPKGGLTEYIGPERYVMSSEDGQNHKFNYDGNIPLIFIGGMPRSGTTLLRVLLDAHPDIRCGEETRVVPRMLGFRQQWMKSPFEARRLKEAGITSEILDSAVASFILEIIAKHGTPAPRLCNKDPFTLRSAVYLRQLFPSSKFIFMIRDGRAVVHSIISRKVTISGFDLSDFSQCMKKWNSAMQAMNYQCQQLGPDVCLPVYYEQLILKPREWLEKILNFLKVPWNDSVLHHEQFINKPGGISLSKLERSTDQVIKPINLEALSKWVGHIPDEVVRDMANIAPMLASLGYDPNANPPDYGKADKFVLLKMKELESNKKTWLEKESEWVKMRDSIRSEIMKKEKPKTPDSDNVPAVEADRTERSADS
ncbi:Protein-tyrosine sulfotransferase [Halotydeus destructor]|nr:Protein-tyrosine sulfotransferase [Halotydeus destructor]